MAFNTEEKWAAAGSLAAAGVPTIANQAGLDGLLVSLSDSVFEGDRGSAAFVSGIGFSGIGALAILAAVLGPLDGYMGVLAVGLGAGSLGIGVQSFAEAAN